MTNVSTLRMLVCSLVLLGTAAAQTQVGQVTLTPLQPTTRSPQPAASPSTSGASTFRISKPPVGWYNLTGRVTAANSPRLPRGSRIILTLENLKAGSPSLVQVNFPSSRLNVPYQMYFNASRLKVGESYGLRATVQDEEGKILYRSPNPVPLPSRLTETVNVVVARIP
ncbi:Type III secretion system lipoprotein chaperone (YscW) [Deinococcus reticulitermitis]|uniref:Type III secretion system lipoprotein chaperone (YscW) n=1 Tax=Deinococcus reticulitermitis TaxID=856736 RepID=A0A1H7CGH6_9DEIO|nr:YbaY family lipoprotein [Deinococcus reticulitermitis]SEJ88576.1 Type III secretion system lipoprotein chaperone (YscW) [Deinococcus reticulitermitis]